MKWSEEAWNAAKPVYEAIKQLPFIQELAAGTLDMRRFKFYINQDSHYLYTYGRVLAHIASRMPDYDGMSAFMRFASESVEMEETLHASYAVERVDKMTLACTFYTSYLKSKAQEPVAVEAAAVLPCFWVYKMIGEYILSIAKMEGNPYADWIETYGGDGFEADTCKAIELCDKLAENAPEGVRKEMTKAYVDCTKLECMFWHNAYKEEYF